MGADFCMAKFPRFQPSEERRGQFRKAIESAKPEDMEWLRDDYYFDDESQEEIIDDMLDAIDAASSISSRETAECLEYNSEGSRIEMTYTGGMSWGDNPTDAYDVLCKAGHLESVYDLAMKFSAEDRA